MEKLIELLNEFEPYIKLDGEYTDNFWWYVSQGNSAVFPKEVGIDRIISNEYGFIKWLVYNDKIDLKKLDKELLKIGIHKNIGFYEGFLMLLSIQNDSLEFLFCMLK